jgi:hypothetical protein
VVHLGSNKTGTSSIQSFLRQNRKRLAAGGVLYPQVPGRTRHSDLGLYVRTDEELSTFPLWHREKRDPDEFRREFHRRLTDEIDEAGLPQVVVSDEALYGLSDPALGRLRALTDEIAASVRLVVYLRRQDDHLVSLYSQEVKAREVQRFDEWIARPRTKTYDYHARLSTWRKHLEPAAFAVRRFERGAMVGGSLYEDFLDAAGLPLSVGDLRAINSRNQTLDAESVEFLRLLNLYRREVEGVAGKLIDNRSLVARLAAQASGPSLTLPSSTLDAVMARWAESNRAVAEEFLHEPGGDLFHEPRSEGRTTTDQRLDPTRIDHYLTLLELPEQVHAPLRQIAEREARAY